MRLNVMKKKGVTALIIVRISKDFVLVTKYATGMTEMPVAFVLCWCDVSLIYFALAAAQFPGRRLEKSFWPSSYSGVLRRTSSSHVLSSTPWATSFSSYSICGCSSVYEVKSTWGQFQVYKFRVFKGVTFKRDFQQGALGNIYSFFSCCTTFWLSLPLKAEKDSARAQIDILHEIHQRRD